MNEFFLKISVVLVGLFVSACADRTIRPDTKFGFNSADGLVVMGARANVSLPWAYTISWRMIDPKTGYFSEEADPVSVGWKALDYLTDRTKNKYMIFRVPPGKYGLEEFSVSSLTNFSFATGHRRSVLAFDVGADEIVYIGEYFITVPGGNLWSARPGSRIDYRKRNDAAAQRALGRYSGVKGPIRFEKPKHARLR